MKETELQKLTDQELRKEDKNTKALIGLFIPIILTLFYFALRNYFNGGEVDFISLTIALCSIGGLVSLFPKLKTVQEELKRRV